MIEKLDALFATFAEFMWGPPLLALLIGGGLFFTLYCRFIPFRYVKHGFNILLGKYDNPNDPGQVNHFQALSSALASTVGMGNISGVAIAIHTGGPGALFWMWISAIVGMATKFFTCTLAIMYRGTDEDGEVQGGPMYVITQGMSKKFHPLAYLFSFAGLLGCLSLFQANQLTQIVQDQIYTPFGYFQNNPMFGQLLIGIFMAGVISAVIFGGIRRIGQVASKLVPSMVAIYMLCGAIILIRNFTMIDDIFLSIVRDAFTGDAVLGGSMGAVIVTGIRRAAFSNEAGIGTEAMAHGAAITKEPVREGLVAMLGPMIDTLIVCSVTGFVILSSGIWDARFQIDKDVEILSNQSTILDIGKLNELEQPDSTWIGLKFNIISPDNENEFVVKIDSILTPNSIYCTLIPGDIDSVIMKKDDWLKLKAEGITLTSMAFTKELYGFGGTILLIIVIVFSLTTMIGYSYYGSKCTAFLFGNKWKQSYRIFYTLSLILASVITIDIVINFIDGMFALMAIPTMVSSIILAPKVMKAARVYFTKLDVQE